MTIREWAEKQLTDRGLWPDEASAVVDAYAEGEESMAHRWNDATEGYPVSLFAVLLLCLSDEAVRWIDANKPKHFARGMFTNEEES